MTVKSGLDTCKDSRYKLVNNPTETYFRECGRPPPAARAQTAYVKTCPNCGQATRDDDRFCASCGQPTDPRRQASAPADDRARRSFASTASINVAGYAHALRRFWWVLVIGAFAALLAALSARFTISIFPPGLEEKDKVSWTAESRLLITSEDNPHFRSKETVFVPRGPGGGTGGATTSGEEDGSATGGEETDGQ
jgi:zinc-ribbon domain